MVLRQQLGTWIHRRVRLELEAKLPKNAAQNNGNVLTHAERPFALRGRDSGVKDGRQPAGESVQLATCLGERTFLCRPGKVFCPLKVPSHDSLSGLLAQPVALKR